MHAEEGIAVRRDEKRCITHRRGPGLVRRRTGVDPAVGLRDRAGDRAAKQLHGALPVGARERMRRRRGEERQAGGPQTASGPPAS